MVKFGLLGVIQKGLCFIEWFPAFAGMTGMGGGGNNLGGGGAI